MRAWIAVLTFILLTASNAFAAGELETRLMKDGWVKLAVEELRALTNFTASDGIGWAEYIDPSGTKVVTQSMSGIISKGTRKITADGRVCHQYNMNSICWFLWKRGENYLSVEINEPVQAPAFLVKGVQFTIKPGNTENL